jgi:hypothetical protein
VVGGAAITAALHVAGHALPDGHLLVTLQER